MTNTTNTPPTLEPCPFCACSMRIESNRDWHRIFGAHTEACLFDEDNEQLMVPATPDQLALMVECWNDRAAPASERPRMLKGIGKYNGDGWKDVTEKGEVVYVWDLEMPKPYAPGQFPRVGNSIWSGSTKQFDFEPVPLAEERAIIDELVTAMRHERNDLQYRLDSLQRQLNDFGAITVGDADQNDTGMWTAGIQIGDHGNKIEIHDSDRKTAEALRDLVYKALTGKVAPDETAQAAKLPTHNTDNQEGCHDASA